MSDKHMPHKTFQYRLYPTKTQAVKLQQYLNACRAFYNACLAEQALWHGATPAQRVACWPQRDPDRQYITTYDFFKTIKHHRRTIPAARPVPVSAYRGAVRDLDAAFKAFFRRVAAGDTPGYPKFRRYRDDRSLRFDEWAGIGIHGQRLKIHNLGRIRVKWHRPLAGTPVSAHVTRKADGWHVSIVCKVPDANPVGVTDQRRVGLDFGLHHLIATSDGYTEDHPRFYVAGMKRLRRLHRKAERQRRFNNPDNYNEDGTAKKGRRPWHESHSYVKTKISIQKQHLKVTRQRRDYINNLVDQLTDAYDLIGVEDLSITRMVHHKRLAVHILDAGWGFFRQRLEQKCLEKGKFFYIVDARHTSTRCSECDQRIEVSGLSQRWVTCDCGMSLDRDVNAARNVLKRAVQAHSAEVGGS